MPLAAKTYDAAIASGAIEIIGEDLIQRFLNRVLEEQVGAGSQHPPQPGGAKLQVGVKAVADLLFLPFDLPKLPGQGLVLQLFLHPPAVFRDSPGSAGRSAPAPGPP